MNTNLNLVERIKDVFCSSQKPDLSRLQFIYANDIVFRDFEREVRGLVPLEDHFSSLCDELLDFRFEFVDQLIGERSVYLKWNLHYRTCSNNRSPRSLRGVSHLKISDRVDFQENFYDLAPVDQADSQWLGAIHRWIGKRAARRSVQIES